MAIAGSIVLAAKVYAAAGACLAGFFLTLGIGRIDPAARGTFVFRVLLIPGTVLLWPLVLMRWKALERQQH